MDEETLQQTESVESASENTSPDGQTELDLLAEISQTLTDLSEVEVNQLDLMKELNSLMQSSIDNQALGLENQQSNLSSLESFSSAESENDTQLFELISEYIQSQNDSESESPVQESSSDSELLQGLTVERQALQDSLISYADLKIESLNLYFAVVFVLLACITGIIAIGYALKRK